MKKIKFSKAEFVTLLIGAISGFSSFLFITVLNNIVGLLMDGNYKSFNPAFILLFGLVIVVFIWSRKVLSMRMIRMTQNLFWKLRSDLIKLVIKSNYEQVYQEKKRIQSALTHDVNIMLQGSLNSIQFLTSVIVVLSCMVYMAYKSFPLFFLTVGVAFLGVIFYLLREKKNNTEFIKARELEDQFQFYFSAILEGSKEIQIDEKKGQAIYAEKIIPLAKRSYKSNVSAFTGFLDNQMVGQVLFYSLISSIVVWFSVSINLNVTTTVNFVFILLYLLGSLETIMVLLPTLVQAKISANKMLDLQNDLKAKVEELEEDNEVVPQKYFTNITAKDLTYFYSDAKSEKKFQIGPINWEINQGDIAFIYGGNGSGKTTFVHTIIGLLINQSGVIYCNGEQLHEENIKAYKANFSVVFNDFFLFDEFYGNRDFDNEKARKLLKWFEIEDKVEMTKNGFSTINLSTGQKKRLALIAAILECKPIIVLDEWAADQDPYFRKKFYEEILPVLQSEGFTILAITHDDRYYHCADKIYKMEFGKLYDETYLHHHEIVQR